MIEIAKTTDPSPFSIGDIIEIRQDNDTNKMNSNRVPNELDLSTFQDAYNIWGARSVGEIVKVLNIIGNTLILDRGLNFHYHAHLFPKSKKINSTTILNQIGKWMNLMLNILKVSDYGMKKKMVKNL